MLVIGPIRFLSPPFRLRVVLWMTLFDLVAGCSGNVSHPPSTVEGEERYVKIVGTTEANNDSPVSRLAHPVVLPEANWARILGDIYVRPRKRWITLARDEQ